MRAFLGLANRALRVVSQRRWSGDEPAADLTWGSLMTGDSLWALYEKYRQFAPNDKILEIGPGYGRLLKTALDRKIPFQSYTALELSKPRVDRLRREFNLRKVHFIQGDIDIWTESSKFNVVICSSTFEHLYPDCRKALKNVQHHLTSTADVFIDFIGNTQRTMFSHFIDNTQRKIVYFEPNGTYIRVYPKEDLFRLFAECGFTVRAIDTCTLGRAKRGPVNRLVVVAERA
jgi:cyclopropane fatty-acyl-phospholipid synthase-like methyltransferase